MTEEEDLLDGCDLDFTEDPTSDDDVDAVVLFAGVSDNQIAGTAAAYRELFSDGV